MTTKPPSDRLDAYFDYIAAVSPPALRAWTATNEADFCAAVGDAVHVAVSRIEAGARQFAVLDERGLSLLLAQLLAAASLPAVAEGFQNGHVDVTVHHPLELVPAMLGECKIYRGFKHHRAGCRQLLTRYSTGRSSCAFCLDFFRKPGMYARLLNLRQAFKRERPLRQVGTVRKHRRIKGAFVTNHRHSSGAVVELVHTGCNLYHARTKTQSKSGGKD